MDLRYIPQTHLINVRKKSSNFHTWQVDDEDLLKPAIELTNIEIERIFFYMTN